ncbi:MAG: tetratricopeptide repeat protein [Planctomycetaceae bacterium]|jgi:tetratricopeptide (TPR) repeat protein|nr:tetratricopeptide repeat protein [Planctomycetaceae bacterium]
MILIRLLWVFLLLIILNGCHWGGALKPITPSQILSGERSRLGIAAMERGDLAEAEKRLEEAVKLNKKDIAYRRYYADALWQRGKYEEALQQLNEAIKRGGTDDASLHISLAEKHLILNRPSTAYQHANTTIRLAPQEYKGWALRGKAGWLLAAGQQLTELQRDESPEKIQQYMIQARNDYYRALSFSPNNRDLLPELAAVQMICRQPEHALATWQNLQDLFPKGAEPADLLRGKAEALIALQRFDEAIHCLHIAHQHEPERPEIQQRIREIIAMTQKKNLF